MYLAVPSWPLYTPPSCPIAKNECHSTSSWESSTRSSVSRRPRASMTRRAISRFPCGSADVRQSDLSSWSAPSKIRTSDFASGRSRRCGRPGNEDVHWAAPAPVAQWIERRPPEAEVGGSNPPGRASDPRHRHGPRRALRRHRRLRADGAARPARHPDPARRRAAAVRLRRGHPAPARAVGGARRPRRALHHPLPRRPRARPARDAQDLRAAGARGAARPSTGRPACGACSRCSRR